MLAPTLLLLQLVAAYALVPWACARGSTAAVHIVMGVALLAALAIAVFAWHQLRQARGAMGREPGSMERERFTRSLSLACSALVVAVIAAQWLTAMILPACI